MAEGYKDWSAGDILTAADLEDYTVKQSVMRFDDSSARTTALSGVLAEGMISYLKDTDSVEVYDGSAWAAVGGKIQQVLSTTKTDTFTTSSGSPVDVTGLSVSITPTSATSKVLIFAMISMSANTATNEAFGQLVRDSTAIAIGDSAGSRLRATFGSDTGGDVGQNSVSVLFLDSPATTSATTYKIQVQSNTSSGGTVVVNRGYNDTDTSTRGRTVSTLTVLEVSA